jgi:hypothetical protein
MRLTALPWTIFTTAILILSSCSPTLDADKAVVRGTGPESNGFLIIGAANENARTELFFASVAFGVDLVGDDGRVVHVFRRGCMSSSGLFSGQTCSSDRHIAEHVVEVPPGDWQVDSIVETDQRGVPARMDVVRAKLPRGIKIHVGPGEIVYAGDFLFTLDQDKVEGSLKSYSRDDSAANAALASYPGLTGGFIYREPTHPIIGGT